MRKGVVLHETVQGSVGSKEDELGPNSRSVGAEQDESGSRKADCRTADVPSVGSHPLDEPEPDNRGEDINASICGIGSACCRRVDTGQGEGKHDERHRAGDGP